MGKNKNLIFCDEDKESNLELSYLESIIVLSIKRAFKGCVRFNMKAHLTKKTEKVIGFHTQER